MAVETVGEVLAEIKQKGSTPNRFSKKAFNRLVKAMVNDPTFTEAVAESSGEELIKVTDVAVSEGFRKFLKKVLEKAGMDKKDSEVVLGKDFTIDNVDGLYEFFSAALYEYMNAGNRFDLLQKENFKGSLYLANVEAGSRVSKVRNPTTNEFMGDFEFSHQAYQTLKVTSPCPKYLKSKKPVK